MPIRLCEWCEAPLRYLASAGRPRRYCDTRCRVAAFRDRELIPTGKKGAGHRPENQALSMYFTFRGVTGESPGGKRDSYGLALAWDPANENARRLRDEL